MDVGSLGIIQPVSTPVDGQSKRTSHTNGFNEIFQSVLADEKVETEMIPIENGELNEEDRNIIKELLQFLQKEDSFELEDLENLLTQADNLLLSLLGAENFELKETLLKLIEGEETNGNINLQPLLNYLNQIVSMPLNDFTKTMNGEEMAIIKLMKIYDFFTAQHEAQEKSALNDLLTQLRNKLEKLLDNSGNNSTTSTFNQLKDGSKLYYLQNKFGQVAAELNANRIMSTVANSSGDKFLTSEKFDTFSGYLQMQQMTKAEQLTLFSQNGKPVSAEQLIRQFENILAKSQFSNIGGTQKLMIKLHPEHLGSLRIELIQKDGSMIAKMLTSTQAAKHLLESQLHSLKQAFASQNIQVDKIEISQQWNQQQKENLLKREGENQQQKYQQNHQQGKDEDEEDSFAFSLEDALVNTEV